MGQRQSRRTRTSTSNADFRNQRLRRSIAFFPTKPLLLLLLIFLVDLLPTTPFAVAVAVAVEAIAEERALETTIILDSLLSPRRKDDSSAYVDPTEWMTTSIGLRKPLRLIDILNKSKRNVKRRPISDSRAAAKDNDSGSSSPPSDVQTLYFTQRLDHFRGSDARTFDQRYFYSDRYARSAKDSTRREIAFVCVGGEGPALTASVLIDSVHCSGDMLETAQRLYNENDTSIHLYALEHRYYGVSYPSFDAGDPYASAVTNDNLVYLSSRQAAADLAHFVTRAVRVQTRDSTNTATILFGGSYPGMLAAWTRLLYPHLIHSAVSNSAPVQAVLDFAAYNNHVAADVSNPDLGGSDSCLNLLRAGHGAVVRSVLRSPDEWPKLAKQFNLCDSNQLSEPRNLQLWLGDGLFGLGTQGNDPACTTAKYCNLAQKCAAITGRFDEEMDDGTNERNATIAAMNTMAWMVSETRNDSDDDCDDDNCIDLDWQGTLDYLADPHRAWEGGLRSWLWQTCTEFGFYQTCETSSSCPYARGMHPLSQDLEICRFAFGVPALQVAAAVQASNEWSGGWHSAATNVLSVTGTADPWSELALEKRRNDDNSNKSLVHQVPGASHHFWTHPVKPTDDAAVQAAREYIYETVRGWLEMETDEKKPCGDASISALLRTIRGARY